MTNAVSEQLRQDVVCEGLLECVYDLKPLDRSCYEVLVESEEPLSIDEVTERVNRERSTAYRSIQRLFESSLVRKEQVTYEQGGYYHVYAPADPSRVAREMRRTLNDWYAKMGQLVYEFEETYDEAIEFAASIENGTAIEDDASIEE